MPTHTVEQYLKAIHRLLEVQGRVGTTSLAQTLGVKPASVTNMLQRLAQTSPPLLEYERHRGVTFTAAGRKVALRAIRHHRLLELYLHQLLGYSWDRVHEEADRMDHVISTEFGDKLAALMENPRFDPHGDPIPTRTLEFPECDLEALGDLQVGQVGVLRRVRDDDPALLRYLGEAGLVPGARLTVVRKEPFEGPITVRVGRGAKGPEQSVGVRIARVLQVAREGRRGPG
ncbi:MAG: metal-dependent transcriptional regulator [Candidatus Latescibacterota bacterium]|jgi:DtxR family Mn-dependent transcriptional regulator